MTQPTIRLGTRGSRLALWQANWVADELSRRGVAVDIVVIQTTGDVRSEAVGALAAQGVFTKEIQRALLERRIDLAVHSLKDLPTESIEGLCLAAVPPRAAEGDVYLSETHPSLNELPAGARVGTGSQRRRAQLQHFRPDLQIVPIRGNVETRLARMQAGELDAIVLAEAGIERLGLTSRYREAIDKRRMLPAVGQGALGLEVRCDDSAARKIVEPLDDPRSRQAVTAERTLLAKLRGGCLAPVGAWGRFEGDELQLDAVVLNVAGSERLQATTRGTADQAVELGTLAAEELLQQGAAELIAESRLPPNPYAG